MKVVIHPAVDPARLAILCAAAPDATLINAATAERAQAEIPNADAFLGKITQPLLAAAPRLRWVQAMTASLEHYMFPELVEHDCLLTNTRGIFGDVIAEQVMGYVLCFARNLHIYIAQRIERRYEPMGGEAARVDNASGPGLTSAMDRAVIDLSEATMGILGFGGIGAETARRALAFGLRVIGVDRFPDRCARVAGVAELRGPDGLHWLLNESDFLVIAAPQTPETQGLFARSVFAAMKPGAILINVGRGAIVVLDDLVHALASGSLRGAALDVFEQEPLPADHPLWDFPNVIITPHTAGYSPKIARRHLEILTENLARFARDEPLINVVDKRLWF